jgi:hypothetical protein
MVKRDEGMIDPTMTGCSRKPSKNTPSGPARRDMRRITRRSQGSRATNSELVMLGEFPICGRQIFGKKK